MRNQAVFAVTLVALLFVASCDDADIDAGPIKIGLITNNPNGLRNIQGFRDGLLEHGYIEDENVAFVYSGRATPVAEFETSIRAMADEGVELVFTAGTPTGVAAYNAIRDRALPVVFGVIADPIAAGVMSDLSRPGGNLTGVMLYQNQARRLELLLAVAPSIHRVWVPYNPDDPAPISAVNQVEDVAHALGLELVRAEARNSDEVTTIFSALPTDIDAIFMVPDSTVNRRIGDLLVLALEHRLPVSGPSTAQVEQGALMTYGFAHHEVGVQAAKIAHRILRGADPATMPVENADFFLTVNLAAAERIGLQVPDDILQQADYILRQDGFGQ